MTELGSRLSWGTLRAAAWAWRATRAARRSLQEHGVAGTVGPPPDLEWAATRGVYAVMHRQPNTCIERSLVLQRWLATHGHPLDVVIGVQRDDRGVRAHAWLECESGGDYEELTRLPPDPS